MVEKPNGPTNRQERFVLQHELLAFSRCSGLRLFASFLKLDQAYPPVKPRAPGPKTAYKPSVRVRQVVSKWWMLLAITSDCDPGPGVLAPHLSLCDEKQKQRRWYPDFAWKSTFPPRTLRRLLVQYILCKSNYCSLLANIELLCLHGSMVLMCLLWLTNHRTPIWDKWTII